MNLCVSAAPRGRCHFFTPSRPSVPRCLSGEGSVPITNPELGECSPFCYTALLWGRELLFVLPPSLPSGSKKGAARPVCQPAESSATNWSAPSPRLGANHSFDMRAKSAVRQISPPVKDSPAHKINCEHGLSLGVQCCRENRIRRNVCEPPSGRKNARASRHLPSAPSAALIAVRLGHRKRL